MSVIAGILSAKPLKIVKFASIAALVFYIIYSVNAFRNDIKESMQREIQSQAEKMIAEMNFQTQKNISEGFKQYIDLQEKNHENTLSRLKSFDEKMQQANKDRQAIQKKLNDFNLEKHIKENPEQAEALINEEKDSLFHEFELIFDGN